MATFLVAMVGYQLLTEVLPEAYCYYTYTDHTNTDQSGTLFCASECCGTLQDRACCSSITESVVAITAAGLMMLVSIAIVVTCCCFKNKKTPIRQIAVPSETSLECVANTDCQVSDPAQHPHSSGYYPPLQEDNASIPSYDPPPYSP